jgi:hypothetical protein
MLAAIGMLAVQQAKVTQHTRCGITHLLNYSATHPDTIIQFIASDMILHVESDASYLSKPKAWSQVAGYYCLSNMPVSPHSPPSPNTPQPTGNGATINVLCQILCKVIHITLEELGHPIQTDNSTAAGIANDTVKQKHSKAIDMNFYWSCNRV